MRVAAGEATDHGTRGCIVVAGRLVAFAIFRAFDWRVCAWGVCNSFRAWFVLYGIIVGCNSLANVCDPPQSERHVSHLKLRRRQIFWKPNCLLPPTKARFCIYRHVTHFFDQSSSHRLPLPSRPRPTAAQTPATAPPSRCNMVLLGDTAPDFTADTTKGPISLHEYIGTSWCILFSHPADFTPICTTELARVAQLVPEFEKRNTKVLGLSCDDLPSHKDWLADIEAFGATEMTALPIIADPTRAIAKSYGMIPTDAPMDDKGMPLTVRSVFVISPEKLVKMTMTYPASTGRSFDEILRVLDSLQLAASHKVGTPVDWKRGKECVVLPSVSDAEATKLFPKGFKPANLPSGKHYLRMTPQPDL